MSDVFYITGDETLIDQIKPLWELLNKHHMRLSEDFADYYKHFTFEQRKISLLAESAQANIRVDIAVKADDDSYMAYCVSSMNHRGIGEIESIYVHEHYRRNGIGTALMDRALEWLKVMGAVKTEISVSAGNEQVFRFYAKHGFFPRKTTLERKIEP